MRTIPVIGLPLAATDYDGAVEWILGRAAAGDRAYAVAAANTHVASLARHDPGFGAAMAGFDLICPDGMPLVWALNAGLGPAERLRDRVYGPTLMLRTVRAAHERGGTRHFLLGGRDSTLEALRARFGREYPGATIVGAYSPPFGEWPEDESRRIVARISASGANVVWVGLGCPKQERWIARHKAELPPAVYLAIGAAFAFHAGEVPQAPRFLQRHGLEWAYRLCAEPRRLARRYLTHNSLFLYYLLRERMRD
jgi:N-acetylglucosaminyldiphosphoundecaprenol N-acetyl-beta-D-mannosaminyltransferase